MTRPESSETRTGSRGLSAVQRARHELFRANEKVPRTLATILVQPREFAARIRAARSKGRNPLRLLRCLDDVERELLRFGIRMAPYFRALRRDAARAMDESGDTPTTRDRGRER